MSSEETKKRTMCYILIVSSVGGDRCDKVSVKRGSGEKGKICAHIGRDKTKYLQFRAACIALW